MSIGNVVKGLAAPGVLVACVCVMSSAQAQTQKSPDQLKCEQAGGRWTVDASPPDVEIGQASEAGSVSGRVAVGDINGDGASVVAPRDAASGQASGKRMHKPVTVCSAGGDCDDTDPAATKRSGVATGAGAAAGACSLAIKTKGLPVQ